MATLGKIVYLSEAQAQTLFAAGTVTAGGVTITYDANDLYITPDGGSVLTSPNGTKYRLTVANDGTLGTAAVN